ncbi:DUF3148 domain-containing protein [filamentous cyanobacterium CCP5]|nr:DUF3148 domain-containing protein [filamentous cyanobacterium CCP5]
MANTSPAFKVGDRVRLAQSPPYFKTADTMPMLRPPDVVPVGAIGVVKDQRSGGYWGIRFDQGSFLVDSQFLESAEEPDGTAQPS